MAPHSNSAPPEPTAELPARCASRYEALLDVATLAQRYGPASSFFVAPIDALANELDDCLSMDGEDQHESALKTLAYRDHGSRS